MQTITEFETLPNEIFIECFEYLNAVDIFNTFDDLNSRFNNLIRNIPLHLNVDDVEESTLVQFVTKMLLNPPMKKQIISLKLSDQKTRNNTGVLLSFITLNELSHLQTLILCNADLHTDSRICSMLPSLRNLRYFRVDDFSLMDLKLFALLPRSTLQILSVSRLPRKLTLIHPLQALVDVTISHGVIDTLCDLFECAPRLQYLHVKSIRGSSSTIVDQSQSSHKHAVHLKQLTIQDLESEFNDLERLLKRTPNLKMLIIGKSHNLDIVNACRWCILIETSLPLLTIFEFKFYYRLENDNNDIVYKFKQFQTDFWHVQHNWYVQYVIYKTKAVIYNVPYIANEYKIMPYSNRCYHDLTNNMNTFANVRDLTIYLENIPDNAKYHFQNVKSLKLQVTEYDEDQDRPFFEMKHIECLRTLINMDKVLHLKLPLGCRWKSRSVILQLLKEASNLSSLELHINTLMAMLNNNGLCKYLRERIKKLNVAERFHCNTLTYYEMVKVCQIFSTLEVFHCNVGSPDNLNMVLYELTKLPNLKVFSYETNNRDSGHYWTGNRKAEMDSYSFSIGCEYRGFDFDDMSYDDDQYDSVDYLERIFDCWWRLRLFQNDLFELIRTGQ